VCARLERSHNFVMFAIQTKTKPPVQKNQPIGKFGLPQEAHCAIEMVVCARLERFVGANVSIFQRRHHTHDVLLSEIVPRKFHVTLHLYFVGSNMKCKFKTVQSPPPLKNHMPPSLRFLILFKAHEPHVQKHEKRQYSSQLCTCLWMCQSEKVKRKRERGREREGKRERESERAKARA